MRREQTEHARLCGTAKGRERLAAQVESLAREHGATVTRGDLWEFAPRRIRLEISLGPYRCGLSFEGGSKVGAFLAHWHVSTKSDAKYPVTFAGDIRGTINTYHYSKATTCANTFEGFLHSLKSGFESLAIEIAELA